MKMKHTLLILAAGLLMPVASVLAQTTVPTPLVKFDFNNGSLVNSGSLGGSLILNTPAALDQGKGVSGHSGDYAFNARGAGTGTFGGNGRFNLSLQNTTSLTFATWYQVDANGLDGQGNLNGSRFFEGNGWNVFLGSDGGLNLTIAGSGIGNSSRTKYDLTPGQWNFLAFTYTWDAQTNKGAVLMYGGSKEDEVTLLGTITGLAGPVLDKDFNWNGFFLGNRADGERAFPGLLDDFSFYGTALTMQQLEAVRAQALIPEASTYSMLLGLFAACGVVAARRRISGAKR